MLVDAEAEAEEQRVGVQVSAAQALGRQEPAVEGHEGLVVAPEVDGAEQDAQGHATRATCHRDVRVLWVNRTIQKQTVYSDTQTKPSPQSNQ